MTKIITKKLNNNNFKLIEFYESRAKRLIPALATLCTTLIIFGWFFLAPEDYRKLAEHAASSINFTSNMTYSKEIDYFNPDSSEKWMLHTWSLSVEWQFYLIFPVILLLFNSINYFRSRLKGILFTLCLTSLTISLYFYFINEEKSYYFLTSRAWEMLAGSLTALININKRAFNNYAWSAFSIFSIIAFACAPKIDSIWPSPLTIIPIIATCIILLQNHNFKLYDNILIKEIGASSYSIYLWHWPIYVLINHLNLQDNLPALILGILLSGVIGFSSKKLIEDRFTHKKDDKIRPYIKYILLILVIHSTCMHIITHKGYPKRMHDSLERLGIDITQLEMASRENGFCFKNFNANRKLTSSDNEDKCWIGEKNTKDTILLFGDSFAGQWEPFWDDIGRSEGIKIRSVTTNWCYPSFNNNYTGPKSHPAYTQCLINRKFLKEHAKDFNTIILAGQWLQMHESGDIDSISEVLKYLTQSDVKVIVMPAPTIFDQDILSKFKFYNFNSLNFDISKLRKEKDEAATVLNNRIENEISGKGEFIERKFLFNQSDLTDKGIPYSLDGKHISIYGAHASYDKFKNTTKYNNLMSFIKNAP